MPQEKCSTRAGRERGGFFGQFVEQPRIVGLLYKACVGRLQNIIAEDSDQSRSSVANWKSITCKS